MCVCVCLGGLYLLSRENMAGRWSLEGGKVNDRRLKPLETPGFVCFPPPPTRHAHAAAPRDGLAGETLPGNKVSAISACERSIGGYSLL